MTTRGNHPRMADLDERIVRRRGYFSDMYVLLTRAKGVVRYWSATAATR